VFKGNGKKKERNDKDERGELSEVPNTIRLTVKKIYVGLKNNGRISTSQIHALYTVRWGGDPNVSRKLWGEHHRDKERERELHAGKAP